MLEALERLDRSIEAAAHLVIGGGAAMVLAYDHPLATADVDAFAGRSGLSMADLAEAARAVAKEMDAAPDWLNAHFETYTAVLPQGYAERLRPVFAGTHLRVDALGPEDLLIMKCFAGRDKDRPHARRLVHLARDLDLVDGHLAHLATRGYPGATRAADYFDDLRDEEDL